MTSLIRPICETVVGGTGGAFAAAALLEDIKKSQIHQIQIEEHLSGDAPREQTSVGEYAMTMLAISGGVLMGSALPRLSSRFGRLTFGVLALTAGVVEQKVAFYWDAYLRRYQRPVRDQSKENV